MGYDWEGDRDDDQTCVAGAYWCHVECLGEDRWFAEVQGPGRMSFHSGDAGILPLSSDAARRLCELVVRVELGRAGHG